MIRRGGVGLLTLGILGAALAGCSSGTPASTATSATVGLPPTQAITGPVGSWATLVMGHLDDPLNTFGELVYRPGCPGVATCAPADWVLATPPGVASNGGLFAASGPVGTLTVGFGVSLGLTFSPLAVTTDAGSTWTAGILPAALVPVTDALATSGNDRLALVPAAGGEVLASAADLSTWSTLVRRSTVAAAAGSGCGLGALTAVSVLRPGADLVAGTCDSGGRAGVFRVGSGGAVASVTPVGPQLPGNVSGPVRTERLVETPTGLDALVVTGSGSSTRIFVARTTDGASTWTISAPYATADAVVSTSVDASGTLVAVLATGHRRTAAVAAPGSSWTTLPTLPVGTTTVTTDADGSFSALVPSGSTLTVDVLSSGSWVRHQVLAVPIQYGSTSAAGGS